MLMAATRSRQRRCAGLGRGLGLGVGVGAALDAEVVGVLGEAGGVLDRVGLGASVIEISGVRGAGPPHPANTIAVIIKGAIHRSVPNGGRTSPH
jgi:hypothetical protein